MLAVQDRKPLPELQLPQPVAAGVASRLQGRYVRDDGRTVDLAARGGKLYAAPAQGYARYELRNLNDHLIADDALLYDRTDLDLRTTGLPPGSRYHHELPSRPAELPAKWRALVGEYGWDHNTLYILEKDGKLFALIEWLFQSPLEEVSENVYRFTATGLYDGEMVTFQRGGDGKTAGVQVGGVFFERRKLDGEDGRTFRIQAQRPIEALRKAALAGHPPREEGTFVPPDLVDLATLDPGIRFDIRYAGTNNFLGTPFYQSPRAFLQRPAAEALLQAHRWLGLRGYGLLIHDAYRPWAVTRMFWDATPEKLRVFVADPAKGSRHNRGCAVDLTLYDLKTGAPIEMVSGYDEFSDRAYPDYPGTSSLQRWHRELLRRAMERQGFDVYETEWWHFDFHGWQKYPIGNVTFEQMTTGASKTPRGASR
jgi:D-alanyl-D-alanine dipeptidase